MFTKNWYKLFAQFVVGSGATFSGVNVNGTQKSLKYYDSTTSNSDNFDFAMPYNLLNKPITSKSTYDKGVYFGTGTTAPTQDDYRLAGNIISSGLNVNTTISGSSDDGGGTATALYTLTNNGSEDITIGEVLMVAYNNSSFFAVERTALEPPLTIPANGGIGQVAYTIRMNYPTA